MKTLAQLMVLVAVLFAAPAVPPASALGGPEKLLYEISWSGIKAGTAVHEVSARGDELRLVYTTGKISMKERPAR